MGRPSFGRRSASSTLGHPAPRCRRCQGKAATGFQWGWPEPGCNSNTTPRDAGTIDHRRAAYPGRAHEPPGGCRGPTGQKLCLTKAGVPLGASRRDFPIHAGSLDPHQAHAQHGACSPGSPRQRAPPPQPSSPPRREGAPRLPPQAWGTLRQRRGSEPLARTTRSAGFQPGHTTGAVPNPVPNPDYHHKVFGGDEAGTVARGLPTGLPAGGTDDDNLIIRNLPLFLSDIARAWLEHLPPGQISLGTPGISGVAASSRESLSGTTSGDSRSSAPSCPTSPTRTSSARSSLAPPAATW
jgi:hypothetical protein